MRRNQQCPNILNLIVWENVLILMMIIEDEYIFFFRPIRPEGQLWGQDRKKSFCDPLWSRGGVRGGVYVMMVTEQGGGEERQGGGRWGGGGDCGRRTDDGAEVSLGWTNGDDCESTDRLCTKMYLDKVWERVCACAQGCDCVWNTQWAISIQIRNK